MERVKLKDICRLINGRAYKQEELLDSGKYPVLRVGNFFSDKDFYYSDLELEEDKYCDNGDLLFAWSASFGPKIWDGEKVIYHYHIWKMELTDRVNKEFLFYHLFHLSERIKSEGHGGIMIHTTKAEMEEREFNLPTLEEQIAISEILNKVKSVIDKRKEELSALDNLIKARFVEMFGDPITNPEGWDIVELGELTDIGSSKRIFEKEYVSEGIPFYRTKEIVELSKGNSVSTELFITEERFAEIKEKYGAPKNGDLLISAVGTIGVIWIVDGKNDFYFKDGNLIRVEGSEKFNSVYMKNLLEYLIDGYKKQMSTGTAYAALTISGLTKMKVYDIPMELQNKFADFVYQVDKSKVVYQGYSQYIA